MKKNKLLKYLAGAVLVLVLFFFIAKKAGWMKSKHTVKVYTEKMSRRNIVETVSANGKIEPEIEVKISADVSGEIVDLFVKEGDVVKKGDLLARIKQEIYLSNLEKMTASVNNSKAGLLNTRARMSQSESQLAKAESNYKRYKKLHDEGAVSDADFEAARTTYEVAKAEVEAAKQSTLASEYGIQGSEASMKEAKENLDKTSVYAPVSGTVSKLNVEKGERVVGTAQMTGTEIMRIADLDEMEVRADVIENDIVRVKRGDSAFIEVDAYLNRKFRGVVTETANTASVNANNDQVTNFTVKVRILKESYSDLQNKNGQHLSPFRPGMTAAVEILTSSKQNTLAVSIQSVTTRDTTVKKPGDNNRNGHQQAVNMRECIFTVEDGKAKLQYVQTGIQDNNFIEILSGGKENMEIIAGPYGEVSRRLRDGSVVEVVTKDQVYEETEE